jgi:hypothetical protein
MTTAVAQHTDSKLNSRALSAADEVAHSFTLTGLIIQQNGKHHGHQKW